MQLEWLRVQPISVANQEELGAALKAIEGDARRTEPVLAFLHGQAGFLTIGIGHPQVSVLMYGGNGGQSPLHAVGDEAARAANADRPFLIFSSYGRPVQLAKWCGLPMATAQFAARIFLERGGELWAGVRWEEEKRPS